MRWIAIGLQLLLGLLFLFSASLKLTGEADAIRDHLGVAPWFWTLTAWVEIVGAAGLLAGVRSARLAVLAGLWLAATMAGGIITHVLAGDSPADALSAAVLLILNLAVATVRSREAALPRLIARTPRPAGR